MSDAVTQPLPPDSAPTPDAEAPARGLSSALTPPLSPEEIRVLACLVEKQCTTPEYYPLTLNALVAACNQKNNRDPVVSYTEDTVSRALDRLRDRRLAAMVSVAGARAPKFKHLFSETFGLDECDTALLCELMLRGPQTPGELRAHCDRFTRMPPVPEIISALDALAARPTPLVVRLPRQPGQKEARYAHLFGAPPTIDETPQTAAPTPAPTLLERLERLEAEVESLRREIRELQACLNPPSTTTKISSGSQSH
ncbi:MAG: YceH family protein [Kiritimatiellae bacterium]|nr:YceH family protein [Kiritimatiellia bacterium]MDW8459256.1 YceH family protein [Verrucomicrobiota bacterium]